MDLYNIEVDANGVLLPLSEIHCSSLKPYQLLKYQDNCVFSEIAKKALMSSGMNVTKMHILIEYNNMETEEVNSRLIYKNDILKCRIKQYITLTDIGIKCYCDKRGNILVNKSKIGGCVLLNSNIIDNINVISRGTTSILKISYFDKCPNIDIFYKNTDTIEKNIHTRMLVGGDFIKIDKPLNIVNNYIDTKMITDFIEYHGNDNVDKNIIISFKNTIKELGVKILDEKYSSFSDTINVLNIENLFSYNNLLLDVKSNDMCQYFRDICRNIKRNTKDKINSLYEREIFPELFLEDELKTEEERFIQKICIKILEKNYMSYKNTELDITIGYDTHIDINKDKKKISIILCFECCKEDDNQVVIISDTDFFDPSHVYVVKPKVLNIISTGDKLCYKNMINIENYIQINIYEKISMDDYVSSTYGRLLKKPMIEIVDDPQGSSSSSSSLHYLSENCPLCLEPLMETETEIENENNTDADADADAKNDMEATTVGSTDDPSHFANRKENIINYIEDTSEKRIQTSNCENLKVDFIEKIYRNYLSGNKVLHFMCNHNITFINNYNENINTLTVNKSIIHKRFHELLKTFIINNGNEKYNINVSHSLFNPAIHVFKKIVVEAINEVYKNNSYLLNIKEIFILHKNKSDFKTTGYNDIIDNKNRNFIVYTSINIDIEDDLFGEITLYTNYVNYEYGKKTLNFIIETEYTKEDIISIEEQEQLIEFANRNIEKIEKIAKCDYSDESKIEKITPFSYGEKNISWDLYSDRWDNIDENIKNILNNTRERIIEKENFNFNYEEPSELPSFFQILKSGSATHYHRDGNDGDMYHIRFNVIIQNAECGGESIYNGVVQKGMERQYIMCRSGIDKHSSRTIIGDKPRLAISYGFNIPKAEISNYPNIFGDLIKDKSI